MKLRFEGDLSELKSGIEILRNVLKFDLSEEGICIKIERSQDKIEVSYQNNEGYIAYNKKIHFFRALGLFIENFQKGDSFHITEEPQFTMNGGMFDFSRNAVMRVESFKKMLDTMAVMGLNMVMLYTEDTYTVEGEPYFGYMRGRYSYQELKELDDYADKYGIEMIPCIQTLGHMEQFLKWESARQLRDRKDILLAGDDKTYEFIKKMVIAASAPFRSKRIHIGMDEAHDLGLGEYLSQFGYKNRFGIMNDHLTRVMDITEKHGLKPMIWSDMYFRLASKTGDYYDEDSTIPQEVIEKYPKNVQLVYWDYYHQYEDDYELFINKHKAFGAPPIFAGGIWTWQGIGTNYGVTFLTTNHALNACKKTGVEEVIATMWGDDGAENNYFSSLLGLQLFAEHGYSKKLDMEKLKKRVKFCTGVDFEAFMNLKYLDETPGSLPDNSDFSNPSKFLLWQDILIGLFDKHVENIDLATHYAKWEINYKEYSEKYSDYSLVFKVPEKLCSVLKIKSDIGVRIKKAYDNNEKNILNEITNIHLPDLKNKVEDLRKTHREQWMKTNKPFGWEVIDIRYGGILARIDTAMFRLNSYIKCDIERIEELEEERLYFDGRTGYEKDKGVGNCSQYSRIVSAGTFTHCMF